MYIARHVEFFLWCLGLALGLGAFAALYWGFVLSPQAIGPQVRTVVPGRQESSRASQDQLRLTTSDFEPLWRRQFRPDWTPRTTSNPKPVVPKPPAPPLRIKLLATFVRSGQFTAILSPVGGQTEYCKVGQVIGEGPAGAEVVHIDSDSVQLRYHEEIVTLTLNAG